MHVYDNEIEKIEIAMTKTVFEANPSDHKCFLLFILLLIKAENYSGQCFHSNIHHTSCVTCV